MLFENSNNQTARTAAGPVNMPPMQPMAKPAQNKTAGGGIATNPAAQVTGWPSAVKMSPKQVPPGPVKNTMRPLQNTGFTGGKSNISTAGFYRQQTQGNTAGKRQIPAQTKSQYSNTNPVYKTVGYGPKPVPKQQATGWGRSRPTAAPAQTNTIKTGGYRINTTSAGSLTGVNRGNNYQGRSKANTGNYYSGNNQPPFYNTPVMVPAPTGRTPFTNQQQGYRQPVSRQHTPCSCNCGNSTVPAQPPAQKQPSSFPENPGYYGSYPPQQIPAPAMKPAGTCHSCGRSGKGCTTIARFAFNSFQLKKRHRAQLKELAMLILSKKINTVIATGHTDSSGTEDYNQELGAKRAATVISELRKELSLLKPNAQRALLWRTDSKGETQPVAANNAANNRRVEICLRRTRP
jgi:outer membrane protein OmpA-like peptidoglycan-associated protein